MIAPYVTYYEFIAMSEEDRQRFVREAVADYLSRHRGTMAGVKPTTLVKEYIRGHNINAFSLFLAEMWNVREVENGGDRWVLVDVRRNRHYTTFLYMRVRGRAVEAAARARE